MRARVWVLSVATVVAVAAGLAGAALLAWPAPRVEADSAALARIELPRLAGRIDAATVRASDGKNVPVRLRAGRLWPTRLVASGLGVTVDVVVRRPGWAGWLVGRTVTRTIRLRTPAARLRGRWLQVPEGKRVRLSFDHPVRVLALGAHGGRRLVSPARSIALGVVAQGSHAAGSVQVAAAARSWERLPAPVRVSWFPARPYPQLMARPAAAATVSPSATLALTFSTPVRAVLGGRLPRVVPATSGRWRLLDAHTLAFSPAGLGFGLGTDVKVVLPRAVYVAGHASAPTRTLGWHVPDGSPLRLQQLFAQLGYLPVTWRPTVDPPSTSVAEQLRAAVSPPAGRFSWRYANVPPELQALWRPGSFDSVTRAAVMTFEDTHDLAVDGFAGPKVWRALLADALAGRRHPGDYSYVFVHRDLPQSLNLWHAGQVILSSPGNTGVPAAPTQLGTWPVFEHVSVGTMSGTNPDGSHYNDPGIRYISYFHGGDAIHAFNRASFGTPQSLGCVELPLTAAAKVWPYTPIGTLVTIEH
jgi:peptidoglycan hydrolase-like protein with peptidoglycan-binding domain